MNTIDVFNPDCFSKEVKVDQDGKGYLSLRGLARLCGINHTSLYRNGAWKNTKLAEYLSERGFEGGAQVFTGLGVPDTVATVVIGYYAMKAGKNCTETAQNTYETIAAIGLRGLIQRAVGWESPPKLTPQQIKEMLLLPVPSEWVRRFPESFYTELERITNLQADGHKRPLLWAQLTKELIYDYLPPFIYQEIKARQSQDKGFEKIHQYLSEDGLIMLEQQQRTVLTLMQASSSIAHVKECLANMAGRVQLRMFDIVSKRLKS